jgi:Kef-type K+ transport system membrane component KefB
MSQAHVDPVAPVLLGLSIIMFAAKLGGVLADRLKQPVVLGELLGGVVLGNLILLNVHLFEFIKHGPIYGIFAGLGVIILLFEVGLESQFAEMVSVGIQSFIVAIAGVILPFVLGYFCSGLIMPELTEISKIFMGAILTATSVGITARVFKDLNFLNTTEARIVLGAAVIDDVLGLIILAIVSSIAASGNIDMASIGLVTAKSFGFVILCVAIGLLVAKRTVQFFSYLNVPGMIVNLALILCFMGAYLANMVGLATIIGAFCIGLVLDDVYIQKYFKADTIEHYIKPISYFLVPIFFVMTGIEVDLSVLADISVLTTALLLTLVAIGGKLICGWCFFTKEKVNRAVIGFGMVPRGEVGLIFASAGKAIGVVNDELFAVTVIVVILTTLVSPPILALLIRK